MPYLTNYRVVQCGATEYKGTTLGTTNQAFWYILLHLNEIRKWLKCLFYKGFEAKRRKWGWEYDNSTYPKGGVSCSADSFVVAESSVLRMKFSAKNPALRVAANRCASLYRTTEKSSAIRLTKENLQSDQETLNNFLENVTVKKTAIELINGQPNFWSILVFYDDHKTERQEKYSDKISIDDENELTDEEKQIFATLKQWRQDKGTQLNIPNFMVCHNTELITIAKVKPQSLDELSKIKGFGGQKISKFGDDIIALLNSI